MILHFELLQTAFAYVIFQPLAPTIVMVLYSVSQQERQTDIIQNGSQCAGSGGDGRILPGDLGHGHLGVYALQEGGEEVQRRRHGDNTTGRTQHQPSCRHLHSHR